MSVIGLNSLHEDPQQVERERLQQLFQQAPGFICVLRGPNHIYEIANDAYYQLVGHRKIMGRVLAEVLPEVVCQGWLDRLDRVFQTGEPFVGRALPIQLQRVADGEMEQRYIDLIYQPILHSNGTVTGIFVQGNDVTDAHLLARQVSYQAAHDSLTGLCNRREFSRQTKQSTGAGPHALLYIDIDHFKIVNDRCGHAAGDNLLVEVARTIRENCKDSDVVARLGGDEFALLRRDCGCEEAVALAENMSKAVKGINFVWQGKRYGITLSVGVARFGEAECVSFEQALGLADSACFLAKDKGRNRVQLSNSSDEDVVLKQRDMDDFTRLKQALADDRIELHVQKIVSFGAERNEPQFLEVLSRLRDVDGSLVQPASFIPAAERFGLIEELDRHIVREAFSSLQSMRSANRQRVYFVNLSGVTLSSACFPAFIDHLLASYPAVAPTQICFEVTETAAVANVRRTADSMTRLTEKGFRFALDDFGSGMASFSYLRHLPAQFVKIDGEFVQSILEDTTNAVIVESVIRVAQSMRMLTIAEYVENDALISTLNEMGVDYGQGFALHRPEPIEVFESSRLLRRPAAVVQDGRARDAMGGRRKRPKR
ncbi:MAG: EAL domain-containing protein [Mesorhizobium sp.]|nr:EAL domain-containing protein [Mesorhizobium sp.]